MFVFAVDDASVSVAAAVPKVSGHSIVDDAIVRVIILFRICSTNLRDRMVHLIFAMLKKVRIPDLLDGFVRDRAQFRFFYTRNL